MVRARVESSWDEVVGRIRALTSLEVTRFEIGEPYTEEMLEVIDLMGATVPPKSMLDFFVQSNGVGLAWRGVLDNAQVRGAIDIVTLLQSSLRVPVEEDGEPLEGVLWKADFEPSVLERLKRMAIFEAIAGRSAYLTYFADENDARLFMVEGQRINPIITDFDTTISLLKRFAGAHGLREHLTHVDWQARIDADTTLQIIARHFSGIAA